MNHLHDKVSALIDGELSASARAKAIAHLHRCAACRHQVADLLDVKQRLAGLAPVEAPADLLLAVGGTTSTAAAGPASGQASTPAGATSPRRYQLVVRSALVGLGSLSAAVLAIAYVVGGADTTPTAKTVDPPVKEFAAEFAGSTGLGPFSDPAVGGLTGSSDATAQTVGTATSSTSSVSAPLPPDSAREMGRFVVVVGAGDDAVAVRDLRRSVWAAERRAYEGTKVVRIVDGRTVTRVLVGVEHFPGQGMTFSVLGGSPDPAETFVAEGEARADGFDQRPLGLLVSAYDVDLAGHAIVDGRRAAVITASRDGQPAAKFWVDAKTGLLLRRDIYADGKLVRSSRFVDVRIFDHSFLPHLPPELQAPAASPLPTSVAPALSDKGFACPQRLPDGFRLVFLHQVDTGASVVHASYSDGLSALSVFEERGSLTPQRLVGFHRGTVDGQPVYLRDGLPSVAVWESAGIVYSAVTDAPAPTTSALVAAMPHVATMPPVGTGTRIGNGLAAMASALTP